MRNTYLIITLKINYSTNLETFYFIILILLVESDQAVKSSITVKDVETKLENSGKRLFPRLLIYFLCYLVPNNYVLLVLFKC